MYAYRRLKRNYVQQIVYRSRDLGYGVDQGTVIGFWTGAVDHWGKFTIRPVEPDIPTLYLFRDEILDVRDYEVNR